MRVAFIGKGGAGKSALAGTFARLLARDGGDVLVLDSDPMPGLAVSLGIDAGDAGLPADAVVEGTEPGGPRYVLRPGLSATEAVERYALRGPDGLRLLQLGKQHGPAAARIRSQWAFRRIVADLPRDGFDLVGDLPGGTRQPFFGWAGFAATLLVVVEPTAKSRLSARRLARLAEDDATPRVVAVANKVREPDDAREVERTTGLEVVAEVPWDEELLACEREAIAPVDGAPGSAAVGAVRSLVQRLRAEEAR